MPAFLYQRAIKNGKRYLTQVQQIPLAGHRIGVIYGLWASRGKPTDVGWCILSADIVRHVFGTHGSISDYEVIIDAAPSVQSLVDLVQLVDIHVYTHSNGAGGASWSNLMLRVKDVCWEEDVMPIRKSELTKNFEEPNAYGDDILTFLYLHGDARSWNWGRVGQMNGAWLHKPARAYFQRFF